MHCTAGKPHLLGGPRVAFGFLQRLPAKDRHQLVSGSTALGRDRRAGLSQAVRGTANKPGLFATAREPRPKSVGGVTPTGLSLK